MRAMMKKGEPEPEPRDLNADIEEVLTLLHSDLVTRQVAVTTQLAADLPTIYGDHIQLQQVLLNLVVNGCDAMQTSTPSERQLIITTARDDADTVRVSVADRGEGIAPKMIERIFDPFYSTKEHGLGMGLAICQTIVRAHRGRLWAENNAPNGATFHFTLKVRTS
jgi:signal transduction histidine kinase